MEPLEEENARLKAGLRYQERTAREGYSGSSTPSSKLPVKPNSQKERPRNRGGGKPGHQGPGSWSVSYYRRAGRRGSQSRHWRQCGSTLEEKGARARAVIDCQAVRMHKIVYHLERKHCPKCNKVISARPPGFWPSACTAINCWPMWRFSIMFTAARWARSKNKQVSATAAWWMRCTNSRKD